MAEDEKDILAELHEAVAKGLLAELLKKNCKASYYAVATKFLKDNNWSADPQKNKGLRNLGELTDRKDYPFATDGVSEEELDDDESEAA
jgi:hypothetical protein